MVERYLFAPNGLLADVRGARFVSRMADNSIFAAYGSATPSDLSGARVYDGSEFGPRPQIRWNIMGSDEGSFLVRLWFDKDQESKIHGLLNLCPSLVESSQLSDGTVLARLSDQYSDKMWENSLFLSALPSVDAGISKIWISAIQEWKDIRVPVAV